MAKAPPLEESNQPGSHPDQDHHVIDDRDDHHYLQDDHHNHDYHYAAIEIIEYHLWPLLQML